ncbi:MAG TPA: hypothetical protein VK892_11305, partial [Pyrinomonadaceae bacterium]|nr:hypothetical protein [Pyrinomonadaceae bacterium]
MKVVQIRKRGRAVPSRPANLFGCSFSLFLECRLKFIAQVSPINRLGRDGFAPLFGCLLKAKNFNLHTLHLIA